MIVPVFFVGGDGRPTSEFDRHQRTVVALERPALHEHAYLRIADDIGIIRDHDLMVVDNPITWANLLQMPLRTPLEADGIGRESTQHAIQCRP